MQWYYASNHQRQGPVSEADFDRLVREGLIESHTLVWRQGMGNWQKYSEVAPTLVPPLPGDPARQPAESANIETALCVMSGKIYPKREMVEYQGQWVSNEHRDQFFQRIREGVPLPGQFVYGGFWLRFVAKIIDGLVLFAVSMAVNLAFGAGPMGQNPGLNPSDPAFIFTFLRHQAVIMAINVAIAIAYNCFFIRKFSATPGKLALGLKLVRSDGSPLSIGRIIGRYFAEIVSAIMLYIGYIIAAFDDEKRTVHDYICDTRVIKSR